MKSIIATLFLTISLSSFSQFYVSFGMSHYDSDISNLGMSVSMGYNKFHFDASGNFASGEGERLDFQSNSSYKIDKKSITVMNIGYNLNITDDFVLTPLIGWALAAEIYQDPIAFDTWFTADAKSSVNAGILATFYTSDNYSISVEIGTFEKIRVAIGYRF